MTAQPPEGARMVLELFASELADRMAVRVLLGSVARIANPGDPREFVAQFEQTLTAQISNGPIVGGDGTLARFDAAVVREAVHSNIRDITGRIDWGD